MVLINDNEKKILCLEDDKLIYYGRFRKINITIIYILDILLITK